jgi:c-di-GMP-binding flagellar brake protein YcgR
MTKAVGINSRVRRSLPKVGQGVEISIDLKVQGKRMHGGRQRDVFPPAPGAFGEGIGTSGLGGKECRFQEAIRRYGPRVWHWTKVEWIGEESLWLLSPMEGNAPMRLPEGAPVQVRYYNRCGVYRFSSRVLPSPYAGGAMVSLAMPDQVERLNKRQYCRVEVSLPMRFWLLDGVSHSKCTDLPHFDAITRDIGVGGVCFETSVQLAAGTPLCLEIDFSEKVGRISVSGRVSWCEPTYWESEATARPQFLVALAFMGVKIPVEDAIMGFVFRQEARLHKMGLL